MTRSYLHSATHVAFDTPTTERLSRLGMNVVRASDTLILGPSRLDPAGHRLMRNAWHGTPFPPQEPEEWDRLYTAEVCWTAPVVVWASARPPETLNLWRTCSWLHDQGLSERDVLVIKLEPEPRRPGVVRHEPFDCSESVANFSDEVLLARLARARSWPRARFARAVDLWRRFVQPNPLGFARRCARAAEVEGILAGTDMIRKPHSDVEEMLDAKGREWARLAFLWGARAPCEARQDVSSQRRLPCSA